MDWYQSPDAFTIQTVPERIAVRGDAWEGFFESAIDLDKLMQHVDASA